MCFWNLNPLLSLKCWNFQTEAEEYACTALIEIRAKFGKHRTTDSVGLNFVQLFWILSHCGAQQRREADMLDLFMCEESSVIHSADDIADVVQCTQTDAQYPYVGYW